MVEFVDDVPARGNGNGHRKSKWDKALSELRQNPGQFGVIATYEKPTTSYTTAANLRKRFPDFEFKARSGDIYGRFAPVGIGVS